MYFFIFWTAILYCFNMVLLCKGFMCLNERETQNLIQKFRSFPWREAGFRAYRMKSDEKSFYVKFMRFFVEKMVQFVINRYFSIFLKGFDDFS